MLCVIGIFDPGCGAWTGLLTLQCLMNRLQSLLTVVWEPLENTCLDSHLWVKRLCGCPGFQIWSLNTPLGQKIQVYAWKGKRNKTNNFTCISASQVAQFSDRKIFLAHGCSLRGKEFEACPASPAVRREPTRRSSFQNCIQVQIPIIKYKLICGYHFIHLKCIFRAWTMLTVYNLPTMKFPFSIEK